jgi:outer membrane biosynthesis protein TonB
MVKTLLRRRDRSESAETDSSANGHPSENGAATALLERPPGPGEPPLEAPVQDAPDGATCATCGARVQDGQEWCLECGTALARNGRRWRVPAVITGVVIAFAITSTAVAFVAISDDGPGTVTVAENPPPVHAPPPAPPAPAPAAAAPKATAPPKKSSTPKPSTAKAPSTSASPTPSTASPVPAPTSPSSSSGSTSGSSSSSGSSGSTNTSGSSGSDSSGSSGSDSSGSSGSDTGDDSLGPSTEDAIPVTLDGDTPVEVYDPYGDGASNSSDLAAATDKDRRTTWSTKEYPDGSVGKGTGLVLRSASPVVARLLQVRTPEPGLSLNVYGSRDATPPDSLAGWHKLASETGVEDKQRIELGTDGQKYRLYLVWITKLPAARTSATLSELELFS